MPGMQRIHQQEAEGERQAVARSQKPASSSVCERPASPTSVIQAARSETCASFNAEAPA